MERHERLPDVMPSTSQLALVGIIALAACAATDPTHDTSSANATVGAGASAGGLDIGGQGIGGGCQIHCSADLHSVMCDDDVVTTCPDDQGCSTSGQCVPACEAAEQHQSTIGCEFYTRRHIGGCFAVYVANTWSADVTLGVEIGGMSYDVEDFARIPIGSGFNLGYGPLTGGVLPENEVAILFLGGFNCPGGVPGWEPFTGADAFRIASSAPVVAYDIEPYEGGTSAITSASLLLPTSAWGTNYIAVQPWPDDINNPPPKLSIIASEDDTEVTLDPVADVTQALVAGMPAPGTPQGIPVTYTLERGQILEIAQDAELTGSVIDATKPIGVIGSTNCFMIDGCCCDSAHQPIPAVRALGHEYAAVPHRNRLTSLAENPPWRIVGAVDGTILTYDPAPPSGAPAAIGLGEVATFRASSPFVVRSQDADHPFYLAGYMTAGGGYQDIGDPEFVNVIPAEQYPSSYVFFTDPTYPSTSLVVVRRKSEGNFADVTLACAGVLGGWTAIGAGDFEYTHVQVVDGLFVPQGGCDNGRHEMQSDAPFGVTVWGWGAADYAEYVSYAYPAGALVRPINSVVIPPAR